MRRWRGLVVALVLGASACAPKTATGDADFKAGKDLAGKEDYAGAVPKFTAALAAGDLSPADQAEAFSQRGRAYVKLGDPGKAAADFSEVIRLLPNQAAPYEERAGAYQSLGQYDRMLFDETAAIEISPQASTTYAYRAIAYRRVRAFDLAMADDSFVLNSHPDDAFAHLGLGRDYAGKGDFDNALAQIEEAVRLKPNDSDGYTERGDIHLQLGDLTAALMDREEAVRFDPDSASTLISRGMVKYVQGRFADALDDFEGAEKLDPTYAYAVIWAYISRLRLGRGDIAILDREARRVDPGKWPWPIIQMLRGAIRADQMQAAALARQYPDRVGQKCEATYYLAQAELAGHGAAQAPALIQQAVRICPDDFFEYAAAKAQAAR